MLASFVAHLSALCTQTLNISCNPMIFTRSLTRGDVICVNSTMPYLAVVFNHWDNCLVSTHRYIRDEVTTDGPYDVTSAYAGFDFGDHGKAGLDVTVTADTELSFGAVAFYARSHVRVISNHPNDHLGLSSTSSDSLLVAHNQHVQYFNTAPGRRRYEVDMSTDVGDWLNFRHDDLSTVNYSGRQTFVRGTSESELVTWRSNSEDLSEFLEIDIMSPDFRPKTYVRFVTNGNKYMPIQWFKMALLPVWIIVIAVVGFVVLVGVVIVVVMLYRRRRRGAMAGLTRPEEELVLD
jgi:hypothetical protein